MVVFVLPSLFEVCDPIVNSFNFIDHTRHWIGSDWILSHPVSNRNESQKIVITSFKSGVEVQKL